jgi:hypothetical protein
LLDRIFATASSLKTAWSDGNREAATGSRAAYSGADMLDADLVGALTHPHSRILVRAMAARWSVVIVSGFVILNDVFMHGADFAPVQKFCPAKVTRKRKGIENVSVLGIRTLVGLCLEGVGDGAVNHVRPARQNTNLNPRGASAVHGLGVITRIPSPSSIRRCLSGVLRCFQWNQI